MCIRCPGHLDGRVGLHKLEERHVPATFFRVAKQLCKLCTQAILLNLFTEKTGKLQDYVNDKPHFCSVGLVSPNGFLTWCNDQSCRSSQGRLR